MTAAAYEAWAGKFFSSANSISICFCLVGLGGSLLVFTGIPGGLTTSKLSRYYLTPMKILIARNKHNVRYDARIKCTFFNKCIIIITCIQYIHNLFFSEKKYNINELPTVSFVAKKCLEVVEGGEGGWSRV